MEEEIKPGGFAGFKLRARKDFSSANSLEDWLAEGSLHLLNELRVYQAELEIQNEELRRAQDEFYAALFGAALIGDYGRRPALIDVSERRRARERLRKAKDELECRMAERAKELKEEMTIRRQAQKALMKGQERYRTLLEEARELSLRDPLTGLANRRLMYIELDRGLARVKRGMQLSVILADVDNFKLVNDTYGHTSGDKLLVELARTIAEQVREADLVVRFGGEEFLVILPDAPLNEAALVAERIRKTVDALRVPSKPGGEALATTVSLGVASCDPAFDSRDELLSRVDAALYRAKAKGRNRVEVLPGMSSKR